MKREMLPPRYTTRFSGAASSRVTAGSALP
ncbi:hypothetical protein KCP73_23890 [Salmonella enterica subsp. enterica]|nr:hypothetical protein KCP73_23890 [Salmonella enterica subsp. enterica]